MPVCVHGFGSDGITRSGCPACDFAERDQLRAEVERLRTSPPSDAEVEEIRGRASRSDSRWSADVAKLLAKLDEAKANEYHEHVHREQAQNECTRLRTSLDAAVGELAKVRGQLDDALKCSTCGGDPQSHPSGKECICAGDGEAEAGTRDGEVMGLRLALYDEQHRNDMSATPPPATEGRTHKWSGAQCEECDLMAYDPKASEPCRPATDEQAGERDAFADELRAAIGLLEVERAKWEAADNWGAHAIVAARILDARFYLGRYEAVSRARAGKGE